MLGLLPSSLLTSHVGQNGGSGPSPRILSMLSGQPTPPNGGVRLFQGWDDDFDGHFDVSPAAAGTTAGTVDRYSYYLDTATAACSITSNTSKNGGFVDIATAAQDNHEAWLKGGVAGQLDDNRFVFEVRAALPTDANSCFLGLTTPGAAAADFISDADALKDDNHIGFLLKSGTLTFVTRKSGQTVKEQATGIGTVTGTHKLGFVYGSRSDADRLKIYFDGILKATLDASEIDSTEVPLSTLLAPIVGHKNTGAAAKTLGLDWGYCGHLMA